MKLSRFNLEELQAFRSTQKLAYDCVCAVEKQLKAGMTERDACALMKDDLRKRGVTQFFHEPFAWFGDRTALRGFGPDTDFLPTDRKLEKGMPVILDIAPIRDGYAADIGYSTSFGRNADVEAMQQALMECRDFILQSVRARKPFRQIYRELDGVIARHGFLNVHRIYPERVLAHRVFRYEHSPVQRFLQRFRVMGFGLPTYLYVLGRSTIARMFPRLGGFAAVERRTRIGSSAVAGPVGRGAAHRDHRLLRRREMGGDPGGHRGRRILAGRRSAALRAGAQERLVARGGCPGSRPLRVRAVG